MDHDFCNVDGARRLKQRIEEYWRERGYTVEVKLVEAGFVAPITGTGAEEAGVTEGEDTGKL